MADAASKRSYQKRTKKIEDFFAYSPQIYNMLPLYIFVFNMLHTMLFTNCETSVGCFTVL